MTTELISHALVIPDDNFNAWLEAVRPYTRKFEKVAVVRSPRGNDLNRYRNVTAVNAPQMWSQDNPLSHIRRIYPMVVRVDIINAQTPQELAAALQRRIDANDRYGTRGGTAHIDDRFILEYPVAFSKLQIVTPFPELPSTDDTFGVMCLSAKGARVVASAAGKVSKVSTSSDALGIGGYVQVTSQHAGKTYTVTYGGLERVSVALNKEVKVGDELGTAAGASVLLALQEAGGGASGYKLPNVLDPARYLYITNLRVRPTSKGLRVRTVPSTTGEILGFVNPWDWLETLEMHGRTLSKLGKADEWLRLKMPDGRPGYCAAWLLEGAIKNPDRLSGINITGVNLDEMHPLGKPPANRLGKIGWVRFGYSVSNKTGSEDIRKAYDRYAPLAERYVKAGYKVVFTTSHETYGEGKDQFWPWASMTDQKWDMLIKPFSEMMYNIARQWAGKGLVEAWQVWNEQDAHLGAEASVAMSPANYKKMLRAVVPAIRAGDPEVFVLTGGYTNTQGERYVRLSIQGLTHDAMPDGLAMHIYGRSCRPNDRYGQYGSIDDLLKAYYAILPKPLWITEWGVLDAPDHNPRDIGDYAMAMVQHIKRNYANLVQALIWYAWAESMHNGFGIVDRNNQPRPGLTERYLNA